MSDIINIDNYLLDGVSPVRTRYDWLDTSKITKKSTTKGNVTAIFASGFQIIGPKNWAKVKTSGDLFINAWYSEVKCTDLNQVLEAVYSGITSNYCTEPGRIIVLLQYKNHKKAAVLTPTGTIECIDETASSIYRDAKNIYEVS